MEKEAAINYIELKKLCNYISRSVVSLLEGDDYSNLSRILDEQNSKDLLDHFITDPQIRSILVRRYSRKDDDDEADSTDPNQNSMDCDCVYELTGDIQFGNSKTASVVFVKQAPYLEADKNMSRQIRVLTLSDKEPYQTLHAYVSSAVAPYFKSYVKETGRAERDGDKMAPNVEKKIAELEMGLLHLQQNIDIPDITLPINSIISQTMKRCQDEEDRMATVNDFGDKVDDSVFLNQLQNGVNRWIREIQRVTKFERDPSSGTALQEISFWLNLERALLRIQEKRESPEVKLTLDILKKGKRFHATVSFDADTQLKETLATVNDYNLLMKDFPLDDLLSATDLDKLSSALLAIFNHLRKIRMTKYPLERVLKLMEAISRDLTAQLLKVLGTRRLMHVPFSEFERVILACTKVFTTWENEYEKLQGLLREVSKKYREGRSKISWRTNLAHQRLQNRMENMKSFRQQHEQLRKVITVVLGPNGSGPRDRVDDSFVSNSSALNNTLDTSSNSLELADGAMLKEVDSAYELVKEMDACDISKEGSDAWEAALARYGERIDRVESCITAKLRDQLGTAKSANEMFRIFSRYNVLFVRPRIKGAIREYQTQLIQRVKDDIETLHENFKIKSASYHQSKTAMMGRVRDIPPKSGLIIWTKQIERQLLVYMKRVGDILGEGWENHLEGQKLSQDAEKFRLKLDTQAIFDEWCRTVTQRHLKPVDANKQLPIPIFIIDSCRAKSGKENILKLRVNFMPEVITLAKEVRHLRALSFRVPLAILNKAHQANQLYPSAMSLIESLKSYERTCEKLEDKSSAKQLVAKMKREVQDQIAEGTNLVWDSYKVENYVQSFSKMIYNFEDQVDELLSLTEKVEVSVGSLSSCNYSHSTFKDILAKIQKAVDDLSLHQYSNLGRWVSELDQRIEKILAARLQAGIEAWTKALTGEQSDLDDNDPQQPAGKLGGEPVISELLHEIRITNQVMHVSPTVEEARYNLLQQLFSWQNVVLVQNRIESTRYQVGLDRSSINQYKNLLTALPDGLISLKAVYKTIEDQIMQMRDYIQRWLAYQSLWDLQPDMLYERLGDDISLWIGTLIEIKNSRATFDTSETRKRIGPIVIDYARVQSKVALQYDSWHKDKVMSKFATLLNSEMLNLHTAISKARSDLEIQSVDSAETRDAVTFITYVQNLKSKSIEWVKQLDLFKLGQLTLERQRFQFPSNWLYVDNLEGEWSAFNEIMKRRESAIQAQIASLQLKIVSQDQAVEQRTKDFLAEWEQGKPIHGSLVPVDALSSLGKYETKFFQLREDRINITRAKSALELVDQSSSVEQFKLLSDRLEVALEELQDLKGVWSKLSTIWGQIEQLRSLPWSAVQPRELRKSLDELANQLKDMPSRLQSYASYDYVKSLIKGYLKTNILIHELKSDALRERHWKQLIKFLNVHWIISDLTLGKVWDIDLQRNENVIKEVITVAQGELALENFLKQVESSWQEYELDLIVYQNKCSLITKWDDLFNKLKEHINSLSAMKLSPYYKQFKDDATKWEEKLNKVSSLFDVWIDVQRRWVYLEGIFSGSSDIQTLMPKETARFKTISSENQSGFLRLMRQVSDKRRVIEVLDIPDIQRNLEWLADQLTATQKALGEYLERERSSFPRFYFVGDEDLLEIIGNSNNISRLQKHFKKMFSGVATLILNSDSTLIEGVCSREGEELRFVSPVSVKDNPKINVWLQLTEKEIRNTLSHLLAKAVVDTSKFKTTGFNRDDYLTWLDTYQAQIAVLASQIAWSESIEYALTTISKNPSLGFKPLDECLKNCESTLQILAEYVLLDQPPIRRKKLEHLITEFVHKRDITRGLIQQRIESPRSFAWLRMMRFYFDPRQQDVLKQLSIHMADAKFFYGFEYLGVQDKLVQTPLTDRCYLTMTQALEARLGGSPFGPAGTGKTETVKALGHQLGRFVLVFNCDENFDFQAVGRIFIGLCQVGAWGCFDEFNRLEERMLSAVSQQIQTIQEALRGSTSSKDKNLVVDLIGKQVSLNSSMAIFITMNPGYAGRSNLPDNLKKLFRPLAMNKPDRQLIAQVMLYSQGFKLAETLANKIVPFFKLCHEQLSSRSHYDFGLRALKNVLVSAGNIKRESLLASDMQTTDDEDIREQKILMQSICETMKPKLVADDIPLLSSLLSDVFPNISYEESKMTELHQKIESVCKDMCLVYGSREAEQGSAWVEKVLQLYQISKLNHGIMLVGPSGCGKSTACRVLLQALESLDNIESVAHVIDPKAISKDVLYGTLDPNTREWSDGLFTHILRKIIDNVRGEINKRHWIIFDGDVDPEWVENLNSVLDDNKLLTLPNGERLSLPPSVRIVFEVQDLKFATLATVSRCGMIWFSEDVMSTKMIVDNFLMLMKTIPLDDLDSNQSGQDFRKMTSGPNDPQAPERMSAALIAQQEIVAILEPHLEEGQILFQTLDFALDQEHIMSFTRSRALKTLFSMLSSTVRSVALYNSNHPDNCMKGEHLRNYVLNSLVFNILWAFTGDAKLEARNALSDFIREHIHSIEIPQGQLVDFEVMINNGRWALWQNRVPQIEVDTHRVAAPDVVVPTVDTVRHEALLNNLLAEHKPLILCGPPGSGKTMTLFSSLRSLANMQVVGLNFSSATTPELLLKTFDHYCVYDRTPNGIVLRPKERGWLILFCDEINLPCMDNYETIRVISFLRQLVEHRGYWRTSDHTWVRVERIQFVGACNPPTDPGRKPLSLRFLRHVPIIYVDYPGETSLKQIYSTFNRAMLRLVPPLRAHSEKLTNVMVSFYLRSQARFTQDMQPHYIYSPRELTRWVRGICEAIRPLGSLTIEELVRLLAHEALRLFQDRLVEETERKWTDENIDDVIKQNFTDIDLSSALARPILYSNWLKRDYVAIDREELREFTKARLKEFCEEELDVELVLFNEVLDHVLRIDRVFRQPQGHLLLIGVSGAGKTTLSKFVAWMNGLSIFQIKVHNRYTAVNFDDDLRSVLRRAGCRNEKICFILDESNVMDSGFLERMNTLLANGEVPGLFEGDELSALMTQCREGSQREGQVIKEPEELYRWFTHQVMKNLHVVFTMNPSTEGLKDRASTSPALFNRCVVNWFGDWSDEALYQVGKQFTARLDIDREYVIPERFPFTFNNLPDRPTHRDAINNAFVYVHQTLHKIYERMRKRNQPVTYITPRHYLDFINQYVKLFHEKCSELQEEQRHLTVGLNRINETVEQVEEMQSSLKIKSAELEAKNREAQLKMENIIQNREEARQRTKESEELQQALQTQETAIAEKRTAVMEDLNKVEPAVKEAQQAVQSIKKQNLIEVRSMTNPPAPVKLAMESICLLLGEPSNDWKSVRSMIVSESFIPTIVNFNSENLSDNIRKQMRDKYLKNPDYTYEKINRASSACGPLVKWACAQLNYADMLRQIDPLRSELKRLESEAGINKKKADENTDILNRLKSTIQSYEEEYGSLKYEAKLIEESLKSVEAKVNRSMALLSSLSSERIRWNTASHEFKSQMENIAGDVLLSSAFLAYAGFFDQQSRTTLFDLWRAHLRQSLIKFRPDLALTEYLSSPDERLKWQANALPSDDLCTENAIMMKRFNRYPLIIDPSGQATKYLLNEFKDRKITRTSFLDDAFRKNLESALRFGNPLLVQDVENYDPILNPILNREVRKTAGRVLISLGDQDIDLSPSFCIFLSTRDPTIDFPPDICSRVTFVNFTITKSSLQSQCLHRVLKAERPDIDEKRSNQLKLQGEYQVRLRSLEKSLLQALNDSKGRILDDDSVISTLERLKLEADDISRKVDDTDRVIEEVNSVSQKYNPFSTACSSIFFTMDRLNQVHSLYQYSLDFFFGILEDVLNRNGNLENVADKAKRLNIITENLFEDVYRRVSRGMLHDDWTVFATLLCRIHLKVLTPELYYEQGFDYFLRNRRAAPKLATDIASSYVSTNKKTTFQAITWLTNRQNECLDSLSQSHLEEFRTISQLISSQADSIKKWLESTNPEADVPILWTQGSHSNPIETSIRKMIIVQALRPDRIPVMIDIFVKTVLGSKFSEAAATDIQLGPVVEKEIKASTPILLCSAPGYDASGRVDDLSAEMNKSITSIAMGSAEGFNQAEIAINGAAKSGRWVMLKNVHLAPQWLVQLEKKLYSLEPNPSFRLFLTLEIHPKIPVNLLRAGRLFVYEPPPGIRANLLRTFATIPASQMMRPPIERSKLYFLVAWFHAIVQERLRYKPLGWSKFYEFNESDLKFAVNTLDTWLDSVAQGRSNIPPEKIPWSAVQTLFGECIYGGKVDNIFDHRLLKSFLRKFFSNRSFDSNFALVESCIDSQSRILVPEGIRRDEFLAWVESLDQSSQSPSWLGLPPNAQRVIMLNLGQEIIRKLLRLQALEDEDEVLVTISQKAGDSSADSSLVSELSGGDVRPTYMKTLSEDVEAWLKYLPEKLDLLKKTVGNIKDPLFRYFERELSCASSLLNDVRRDLSELQLICDPEKRTKQTNYYREMVEKLVKEQIPEHWIRYKVPKDMKVSNWISDFGDRLKELAHILKNSSNLKKIPVRMGKLLNPEAYITATRQFVAQANSWSLEELQLEFTVIGTNESRAADDSSFIMMDLHLEGATTKDNKLHLTAAMASEMIRASLRWVPKDPNKKKSECISIPVYLDQTRNDLLFTVEMEPAGEDDVCAFFERGVALICCATSA